MTANVLRILGMIAAPVSQQIGVAAVRISIAIVFLWIGALKFVPYEADSITPFVANSPVMSFFYKHPEDYKAHLTREGELKPAARAWRQQTTPTRSHTDEGLLSRLSDSWCWRALCRCAWDFLEQSWRFSHPSSPSPSS